MFYMVRIKNDQFPWLETMTHAAIFITSGAQTGRGSHHWPGMGPSCDHAGHTAALWDTSRTLKYQWSILAKRKFLCSWILVKMRKLTRRGLNHYLPIMFATESPVFIINTFSFSPWFPPVQCPVSGPLSSVSSHRPDRLCCARLMPSKLSVKNPILSQNHLLQLFIRDRKFLFVFVV